ncbi:SDR family NAD(P)-dependent oxidoreductase [Ktedonosporobacter rubrisoli]|nr:SDR family oxidoreductase [Ktedonosporobacter rubrisoli]
MKVAIITGGSRGLGKNMALNIASKGQDVILTYNSQQKEAEEVVASIEKLGRKAVALQLDVSDTKSFVAFREAVKEKLTQVWNRDNFNFLVNNAGFGIYAPFAETTEEQFDKMVNVHIKGTFFLTQALLPLLADGGRIINISTGLTRFASSGYSAYATMKGAIEVLTHYLATELGSRGITANTVAPGAIATDFIGGAVRDNPELNQLVAAQTALGRVGQAEDIGGVVAALLSEETRWITAERIEVSGGMYL